MGAYVEAGSVGVLTGLGPEQVTQTEMGGTQLSWFDPPVKETGMLFNREVCYHPMQTLNSGGPYTFLLAGEKVSGKKAASERRFYISFIIQGLFVDASSFRICGKYQVMKEDPLTRTLSKLGEEDKPSVCNLMGISLWENIQVNNENGFGGKMRATIFPYFTLDSSQRGKRLVCDHYKYPPKRIFGNGPDFWSRCISDAPYQRWHGNGHGWKV